ncbi:alpha/beta fold hydrolase [Oxalobacteraceae bacterium CAVE-383]|nr:alpha/beta fold hydrolase [Oxalobacteraceae bacterium CAVE-383]
MIARIAKSVLLVQLGIIAALFLAIEKFWLTESPFTSLLLATAAVVSVRALITANTFMLSLPYEGGGSHTRRLAAAENAMLFLQEFGASLLCSSVGLPFRQFDKRVFADSTALPVLLIHGYGCNSGYWYQMSKALQQARITHYALDMEPVLSSIDSYVSLIEAAVQRVRAETGSAKVVIVAHSMGGLAARAYLRDVGGASVAKIITLGTPHHGTTLANFGIGINCGEMNWVGRAEEGPDSRWLHLLEAAEDKQLRHLIVSIYSHHDNIVSPQRSSHLPFARNIAVDAIGHVALAFSPDIQARVIEEINKAGNETSSLPPSVTSLQAYQERQRSA